MRKLPPVFHDVVNRVVSFDPKDGSAAESIACDDDLFIGCGIDIVLRNDLVACVNSELPPNSIGSSLKLFQNADEVAAFRGGRFGGIMRPVVVHGFRRGGAFPGRASLPGCRGAPRALDR